MCLQFGAQQEDFEYSEFPAKVTGNDCFSTCPGQNDWYETVKLNYGVDYVNGRTLHFDPVPNTWAKMLDILLFWAEKGIDGFQMCIRDRSKDHGYPPQMNKGHGGGTMIY